MKLFFADSHIENIALEELELIFKELITYKANELIMLGDYWHKNKPTPEELYFGTRWAKIFKDNFKKTVFIRGTGAHDKEGNYNTIDYLKYLGIEIMDEYVDEDNNLFGHFFTDESKFEYGTHKYTLKSLLAKYNKIFLGHFHSYQELCKGRAWHISSCRYRNWNESEDKNKYFVKLDKEVEFIPIKTVIPMIDIYSLDELPNIKAKTKVRWVVKNFKDFITGINKMKEYKNKFVDFKIKQDFAIVNAKKVEKKVDNKTIRDYIDSIKDKDVKQLLLEVIK